MRKNFLLSCALTLCSPPLIMAQSITNVTSSFVQHKVFYDYNGDGKLEYLGQPGNGNNWCWYNKEGVAVKEITGTSKYTFSESNILIMDDLNNDDVPDIILQGRILAMSQGTSYQLVDDFTQGSFGENYPLLKTCAMDINHDGKKDILGFLAGKDAQGYITTYTPVAYLQQDSGKFLYTPIQFSQSPIASSSGNSFTQRASIPYGISVINGMFADDIPSEVLTSYMTSIQDKVSFVDVNNDGYLDIIDSSDGFSIFSLPDGSYYPVSFKGKM